MPYVHITSAKKIDDAVKEKLNLGICEIISTLPGKDKDNTLLAITDCGTAMFKSGAYNHGVFVEVRLYKKSPEENKKALAEKMYELLKKTLDLPEDGCVYMNYLEFDNWAANGNYF
ncbi:MAG: 4-oxalocrotonate tautomerase family protein [Oscillospiraceae bacterium]|nr:4-oxalocrotonate tautomerase family protein [Oscillospiraceae bacterium]